MILLVKLFLTHIIGDFFLQPQTWVSAKESKKLKAYQLYLHALVHGILVLLLVWDWAFLLWTLLLAVLHLLIDVAKVYLQTQSSKRFYFFADQLIHGLAIYVVFASCTGYSFFSALLFNNANLLGLAFILFLTIPVSVFMKKFMEKWSPVSQATDDSLQSAGQIIGILERLLVFVFVIRDRKSV